MHQHLVLEIFRVGNWGWHELRALIKHASALSMHIVLYTVSGISAYNTFRRFFNRRVNTVHVITSVAIIAEQ